MNWKALLGAALGAEAPKLKEAFVPPKEGAALLELPKLKDLKK